MQIKGYTKMMVYLISDMREFCDQLDMKEIEPFKMWLSHMGKGGLNNIKGPADLVSEIKKYRKQGYSDSWIELRLRNKEIHKGLVNEWTQHGAQSGVDYITLTDDVLEGWSGMRTADYKDYKSLNGKDGSLRDNMTRWELFFSSLAEQLAKDVLYEKKYEGFSRTRDISYKGGERAKAVRNEYETKLKRRIMTSLTLKKFKENNLH